jgi:FkbM family methyltransferase
MLGRLIRRVLRKACSLRHFRRDPRLQRRIEITCSCRDSDSLPKAPGAGQVVRRDGRRVQRMHQGVLVPAGGYHGEWMTELIRRLRGHHEPQEELLFHHLLQHCRPGTRMVEVGAFWAYYTAWFLSTVPESTAVCLEPDAANADCGKETLALNGLSATWITGAAGRKHLPETRFERESNGQAVILPVHSLASLLQLAGNGPVELLHIDAQGAELPFLESLADPLVKGLVRFLVVSTHHAQYSGSPTTHEDCLRVIGELGGTVLEEHTVEESFSGDGLIVASLSPQDAAISLPAISRNDAKSSLFGFPKSPAGDVLLVESQLGPMVIHQADTVIGRSLHDHGRWEEDGLKDVVRFLRRTHGFTPHTFLAAGANIGTVLLRAIRDGMFQSGIAIEMNPVNFRLLAVNTALNKTAVSPTLINVALGDTVGEARMELSPDNFGDHRIRVADADTGGRYGEETRRLSAVPMTTLDQIELEHGLHFDGSTLFWIDTQGFEGHVLTGAASIMSRPRDGRPVVVCELWPYGLERSGGRERLFDFLAECSAIYNLSGAGWQSAGPLGLVEVQALYERLLGDRSHPATGHVDLLCIP